MFRKQECVAMLLAGGQGSRLGVLTTQSGETSGPLWREIPHHRFPSVQLCQFRH